MAVSSRSSGYQFCTRLCQSGLGGRNGDDSDNESPSPPSRDLVGSGEPSLPTTWLCPSSPWNAPDLSILSFHMCAMRCLLLCSAV